MLRGNSNYSQLPSGSNGSAGNSHPQLGGGSAHPGPSPAPEQGTNMQPETRLLHHGFTSSTSSHRNELSLDAPYPSSSPYSLRKRLRSRPQQPDQLSLSSESSLPSYGLRQDMPFDYVRGSEGCESDSEEDREPQTPYHRLEDDGRGTSPEKAPPRKRPRPHLDADDVGRFAGMSIFEEASKGSVDQLLRRTRDGLDAPPSSPLSPRKPLLPTSSLASFDGSPGQLTSSLKLQASTSVQRQVYEDIGEVEDARMAKAPSSWDIDPHRTYVCSLEEDLSDGDVPHETQRHPQAEDPTVNAGKLPDITQEEAQKLAFIKDVEAGKHLRTAIDGLSSDGSPFAINHELLAKLEAHSRAIVLGGDISSRRIAGRRSGGTTPAITPPTQEEAKGELVLWRSPEEILALSGKTGSGTTEDTTAQRGQGSNFPAFSSSSPLMGDHSGSTGASNSHNANSRQTSVFTFGTHSPPQSFCPSFGNSADSVSRTQFTPDAVWSGESNGMAIQETEQSMDLDE